LKSRHVRLSGNLISGRLGSQNVEVSNLSLTGALLLVDEPLPVDSRSTLVLVRDSIEVTIPSQIIRSDPAKDSSKWLLAVVFLSLSEETKRLIPQLY
jgi:hypothetical protein